MKRVVTSDVVLAASLVFLGHRLGEVRVNSIGMGTFEFASVDDKTLLSYESGGMHVEPKTFDAIKAKLVRLARDKGKEQERARQGLSSM